LGKAALLPPDPEQGREARRPRSTAVGGAPGSAATGNRGKRRWGRGLPIPSLTLVGDGLWRWPLSVGWLQAVRLSWRRSGVQGGRGRWLAAVRGEAASSRPLFIGAGRRWKGRNSSTRSLCGHQWRFKEKNLTVDSAGEASAGNRGGGVTAMLRTRPVEQRRDDGRRRGRTVACSDDGATAR
jgi:hypothetical protein